MQYEPIPPNLIGVMESMRKDVGNNNFSISNHANHRMVTRGVDIKEIIETVKFGAAAKGKKVVDYIGGKFVWKDLAVVIYKPFGDYNARPSIVTVYKDGENDDYAVEDLPSVQEVTKLKEKVEEMQTKAMRDIDLMSDEDLELILAARRERRKVEESRKKEAAEQALREEREDIFEEIETLRSRLDEIALALGEKVVVETPAEKTAREAKTPRYEPKIGPGMKTAQGGKSLDPADFDAAIKELERDENGVYRGCKELARERKLALAAFCIYCRQKGMRIA